MSDTISFRELCEVRAEEMTHVLPEMQTQVDYQGKTKVIKSPRASIRGYIGRGKDK